VKRLPAAFGLAACLLAAIAASAPVAAETPATAVASEFPVFEGWSPLGEVEVFIPDTLWKLINGAADQYLAYGFERLLYRELIAGERELAVEIYNMGTRLNAYGIYRAECGDGAARLPVGVEAALALPHQALMLAGASFVRLTPLAGELDEAAAHALLGEVASFLPGDDSWPEELGWLPERGRVAGTEGYTRRAYLGLRELGPCVHADYRNGHGLFLVLPGSQYSAEDLWQALAESWESRRHRGSKFLLREIPYRGWVGVVETERGLLGTVDEVEKRLLARLRDLSR